jgi:hypothetical protein
MEGRHIFSQIFAGVHKEPNEDTKFDRLSEEAHVQYNDKSDNGRYLDLDHEWTRVVCSLEDQIALWARAVKDEVVFVDMVVLWNEGFFEDMALEEIGCVHTRDDVEWVYANHTADEAGSDGKKTEEK